MMAQDALYHVKCLVSLYNKGKDTKRTLDDQNDINHDIALGELVSNIDNARIDSHVASVFKLTDLTILYSNRLKQLGTVLPGRVHSPNSSTRSCHIFPDINKHKLAEMFCLLSTRTLDQPFTKPVNTMLIVMVFILL